MKNSKLVVTKNNSFSAILEPLLSSTCNPVVLAASATGLLELGNLGTNSLWNTLTVRVMFSIETDMGSIHLFNSAREDP